MNAPTRVLERPVPVEPYWRRVPGADVLLQAIALDPDDATAHLALADLCEEHGESARAEFIRVQVDAARYGLSRWAAEARADELREDNGGDWCEGLPDIPGVRWNDAENFSRGLLRGVCLDAPPSDDDAFAIFDAIDVRSLRFREVDHPCGDGLAALIRSADEVDFGDIAADVFRRLLAALVAAKSEPARGPASHRPRRSLIGFGTSYVRMDADDMADLTSAPPFVGLRRLALRNCSLDRETAQLLAGWPGCRSLTSLDMRGSLLGDAGASALAASPHLAGLRTLRLDGCRIGDRGTTAIARSATLRAAGTITVAGNRLRPEAVTGLGGRLFDGDILNLGGTRLGDAGLAALLAAWGDRTCRGLSLSRCELTAAGMSALAAHPGLASVGTLVLRFNPIGPAGSAALLRSPYLGRLEALWLLCSGSTPTDAVGPWRWPPALRALALSDVSAAFVPSLANRPVPPDLRELRVVSSGLTPDDLSGLLAALPVGVERLTLNANPLGDDGARLLADAHRLRSIRELRVRDCDIGRAGMSALLSSPVLGQLRTLDAVGVPMSDEDVRALGDGECSPSLRKLWFRARTTATDAVERMRRTKAFRGVTDMSVQFLDPPPAEVSSRDPHT